MEQNIFEEGYEHLLALPEGQAIVDFAGSQVQHVALPADDDDEAFPAHYDPADGTFSAKIAEANGADMAHVSTHEITHARQFSALPILSHYAIFANSKDPEAFLNQADTFFMPPSQNMQLLLLGERDAYATQFQIAISLHEMGNSEVLESLLESSRAPMHVIDNLISSVNKHPASQDPERRKAMIRYMVATVIYDNLPACQAEGLAKDLYGHRYKAWFEKLAEFIESGKRPAIPADKFVKLTPEEMLIPFIRDSEPSMLALMQDPRTLLALEASAAETYRALDQRFGLTTDTSALPSYTQALTPRTNIGNGAVLEINPPC